MPASATTHDNAETSRGSRGAPARSRAWVPGRYSSRVSVAAGVTGSAPVRADAGTGASASTPVTHSAQQEAATREKNLMVIPQT